MIYMLSSEIHILSAKNAERLKLILCDNKAKHLVL